MIQVQVFMSFDLLRQTACNYKKTIFYIQAAIVIARLAMQPGIHISRQKLKYKSDGQMKRIEAY